MPPRVANDNELFDRKFCEEYEHLLATIKCSMAKCSEPGCVLKLFTKGHDFKENTTAKSRGSVKGTKCGRSATFGTCLQQWFSLGIIEDLMKQAKEGKTTSIMPAPTISLEDQRKSETMGRNDRAIAMIAESITATIESVKVLKRQGEEDKEAQAAIEKRMAEAKYVTQDLLDNPSIMQQNLAVAESCRKIGKEISGQDIKPTKVLDTPPTRTLAYNQVTRATAEQTPTSWPTLAMANSVENRNGPVIRSQVTADKEIEKANFCKSYADALRIKKEAKAVKENQKTPSPRHRTQQDNADDLTEICVKDMEHEKAGILRRNLKNILRDDQHCFHIRYMQAERVELLVPRHQAQAVKDRLIQVGHAVVNDYSIDGMQVRREGNDEEKRRRRNAYCAHRALTRTLNRGNLGRSVTLFYQKKRDDIEAAFPKVFTDKGREEFDLDYGVPTKTKHSTTNNAVKKIVPAEARDNSVPTTK